MNAPENVELYKALIQAQKAAKPVEKDSTNEYHKYRYASAEDVITEARACLNGAGLAVFPISSSLAREGDRCNVYVSYRVVHETGKFVDMSSTTPVVPEKGRPDDKALAGALTYSLAYFLRGLLLLPRVEEGTDVDKRADGPPAPKPAGRGGIDPAFMTVLKAAPLEALDGLAHGIVDAMDQGHITQAEGVMRQSAWLNRRKELTK